MVKAHHPNIYLSVVTGAIPRRDLAGNEIDQDALFQEVESFGS
jgi:hypothetical protein